MSEKHMFDILQKLVSKKEMDALAESLVITVRDGYELFGQYLISESKGKYTVTRYGSHLEKTFFSLQNAVVYASCDARNMIVQAQRISELDVLLEGSTASVDLYKVLSEKTKDLDKRGLHFTKLNEAKLKKKHIVSELTRYINETKRWQESKFKQAAK